MENDKYSRKNVTNLLSIIKYIRKKETCEFYTDLQDKCIEKWKEITKNMQKYDDFEFEEHISKKEVNELIKFVEDSSKKLKETHPVYNITDGIIKEDGLIKKGVSPENEDYINAEKIILNAKTINLPFMNFPVTVSFQKLVHHELGKIVFNVQCESSKTNRYNKYSVATIHHVDNKNTALLYLEKNETINDLELKYFEDAVVSMFNVGEHQFIIILTTKIDGTLEDAVLTDDEKKKVVQDIVQGLLELHQNEIVHSNLTKKNIVYKRTEEGIVAKIGGFLYATELSNITEYGGLNDDDLICPENYKEKRTFQSDVWDLGMLIDGIINEIPIMDKIPETNIIDPIKPFKGYDMTMTKKINKTLNKFIKLYKWVEDKDKRLSDNKFYNHVLKRIFVENPIERACLYKILRKINKA